MSLPPPNGKEENHRDTNSSLPDASQRNMPESSPESDLTTWTSTLKRVTSTILPSVGNALKARSSPPIDEAQSKPSDVQDLNFTRFDDNPVDDHPRMQSKADEW